ncbi:MAG: DUF4760 domain-containing protein [Patescibacteria group bacterium]
MEKIKNIWTKILLYSVIIIYFVGIFLIVSGFYLLFTGQKSLFDSVILITGALASISVVYLAEQIRVAVEQEKAKRSYEYFARYNNESFKETTAEALVFLRDGGKTKNARLDIISNMKNPQYKKIRPIVTLYFNFFEDLAIFYNRNLLNKELIRSFFKSIALTAHDEGKDCIDKLRADANSSTFYKEWEKMNEDLKSKKITGEK